MSKAFLHKNIIYCLIDPLDNKVFYIGKSTSGLKRPKEHFKPSSLLKNNLKNSKIKSIKLKNQTPKIAILATSEEKEDLFFLEIQFIKFFKENGISLCNHTEGGEGTLGYKLSEETKMKISQRQKEHARNQKTPKVPWNKRKHLEIDSILYKECSKCKKILNLTEYNLYNKTWDKLSRECKKCQQNYAKQHRLKHHKKLSKEQITLSYKNRSIKISSSLKTMYKEAPYKIKHLKKIKCKPIKGVHYLTGEVIYFDSAISAKNCGFNNTNLGVAIKTGKVYKGYKWYFLN